MCTQWIQHDWECQLQNEGAIQNQNYTSDIPSLLYLTAQQTEKCLLLTEKKQYHTEVPVNVSLRCTQVHYLSTTACHLLTVPTNYDQTEVKTITGKRWRWVFLHIKFHLTTDFLYLNKQITQLSPVIFY